MSSAANVIVERHSDTSGVVNVSTGPGGGGSIRLAPASPAPPPAAASAPQPPPPAAAPRRPMPPPRPAPQAQPRVPARDMRDTFAGLANPSKLLPPPQDDEDDEFGDDSSEGEDDGGFGSEPGGSDDAGGSLLGGSEGDAQDDLPDDEQEPFEDELKPSEGFRTLEEEKSDIIFKLTRLKKQGLPGLRQFTVHSDIRDMRAELKRIKTELELDSSLKFQRKMLMAVVSGLEFVNRKYSPLELQLDGWSETVHDNINDYDSVFEELFYKYRNKVKMPPEVSLILMVGGSALMFHYTNTMLKTSLPQLSPAALQGMQNMFANMQQNQQQQQQQGQPQQAPQSQPQQPPQNQQPQQPQQPQNDGARRQMRGPGMDLGMLLGGLPPMPPTMMTPPQPSQSARATPPPPRPPVVHAQPPPRPQPQQLQQLPVIREVDDAMSDRLSDVVSEDLQSVPEDLQSVASDIDGGRGVRKRGVKEITLTEPVRRGGGKRSAKAKNVVVI